MVVASVGSASSISAASGATFWEQYVRAPAPDRPNPCWHVSPAIDMASYHFSWLWLLAPMMLLGPDRYQDYLLFFAIAMAFNFAHRHYGLPYAYLDGDVFHTYQKQLTWFPLFCVALMVATPFLITKPSVAPVGRPVVSAIVFFSLLWNFWHTHMQKYGIMRLYMAKDPAAAQFKTPGWVDRLFIFAWFPLYFSYLAPTQRRSIIENGQAIKVYTTAVIDFLEKYQALLVIPSVLFTTVAVGIWVWHDWRAHRLRNRARISAATGNLLLSSSLLWADPIKAYIAFAFSHAFEYMVFVWAYQRRAYRVQKERPTIMQRLLQHPVRWYVAFSAVLLAVGAGSTWYGRTLLMDMQFLGLIATGWIFYYAVYESLIHFYMDGFLWKMRKAQVRANI